MIAILYFSHLLPVIIYLTFRTFVSSHIFQSLAQFEPDHIQDLWTLL